MFSEAKPERVVFVCRTCGARSERDDEDGGMCVPKGLGAWRGHDWEPPGKGASR